MTNQELFKIYGNVLLRVIVVLWKLFTKPESLTSEGFIYGIGVTGGASIAIGNFAITFGLFQYKKNVTYWIFKSFVSRPANGHIVSLKLSNKIARTPQFAYAFA